MTKWLIEGAMVVVLFAASCAWGAAYTRASAASGRQPFFYQSTFEPAVMIACGRGFSVAASPRPSLNPFLATELDRFACSDLPSDLVVAPASGQPALSKHLMFAVGWFWRATGMSWSGLSGFTGILFGLSIAIAYALFRLGTNPALATAGALVLMVSPLQLLNLPHLADYAKTPFMLALILVTAVTVRQAYSRGQMLVAGAIFGAVLGVGYGFRSDVIVMLPAFSLAVLLLARGTLRATWPARLGSLATCLIVFAMVAWPLLGQRRESGSCQGHVTILGMMSDFTRALGIVVPAYDIGHAYHDMFAYETAAAFAHRIGAPGIIDYCSPEHDAAAGAFLAAVATTMPADLLVRTYASVRKIPELAFGWPDSPLPGWYDRLYEWRQPIVGRLQSTGLLWVSLAVIVVTMADIRLGVLAAFLVLYLGAFPAVQFANRHHFFLEVLPVWCGTVVLGAIWHVARRGSQAWRGRSTHHAVLSLAFPIGVVLLMAGVLYGARAVQQRRMISLLESYSSAPREALSDLPFREPERLGSGQPSALVVATVDPRACGGDVQVTFQYDESHPDERFFTRHVRIAGDAPGPVRVFAPSYRGLQRVTATPQSPGCLQTVERVRTGEPLWVFATLGSDWREGDLFQRLSGVFEPYHESGH